LSEATAVARAVAKLWLTSAAPSGGASGQEQPGTATVLLAGRPVTADGHAVVLPESATPAERTAAEELQYHLFLITGQELEIVPEGKQGGRGSFFIGRCKSRPVPEGEMQGLGSDGILIQSSGQDLLLTGNQRGVLYAVSVFLEDYLGCRWFTADCMSVPKGGRIEIPGGILRRYVPPVAVRDTNYPGLFPAAFAARCRINGTNADVDQRHGGKVDYFPFVHSFYSLVPPAQYYDGHPDYFSLRRGVRMREGGQLCLTSPGVLEVAIEQVRQWIRQRPDAAIYSVSQNDNGSYCECSACTALAEAEGSQAGPVLHFVNAVADAIKDEHPDKVIDTLAYSYTRKPPLKVRPRPNVTVRLCSFECCFAHPLGTCPANQSFVEDLRAWARICPRLSVWDYVIQYGHTIAPFPNLYSLRPNIQLFVEHGVNNIFEEANYFSRGGELIELRAYMLAKTLWGPKYDTDRAIDEFVSAYYGAAAPYLRRYVNLVHEGFKDGSGYHVQIWGWDPREYMPSDFVARAQELFCKARHAVRDDPVLLHRVRVAHLPALYLVLNGCAVYERQGDLLVDPDVPRGSDWLEEFRQVVAAERITSHREGADVQQWLASVAPPPPRLPVERLTSSWVEVEIVPGFGGRILAVRDLEGGVNWTKLYSTQGRIRLLGSGIEDYSEPKHLSPGCLEPYEVVERTPTSMTMCARLKSGLELERRVWLAAGEARVRIRSELRNGADRPRPACLRMSAHLEVTDVARAHLILMGPGDAWRKRGFPAPPSGMPDGDLRLDGEQRPRGAWGIVDEVTGRCLVDRVVGGEVEAYYASWNPRDRAVNLQLWSPSRELEPGGVLCIEHEFELRGEAPQGAQPQRGG